MREILEQADRVSYYGFIMSLAKHETINETIGGFTLCCSHSTQSKPFSQQIKISFLSFNSSLLPDHAGALPSKAELLIDPEMDQELDKL